MKKYYWPLRWQSIDYTFLLSLMARLPLAFGQTLSNWRGALNGCLNRDWAELALGSPYIAKRTVLAAKQLWPELSASQAIRLRYQSVSKEEWHGAILSQAKPAALRQMNLDLSALKAMLKQASPGKGLVVLTAHFDSVTLGVVGLGLCGRITSVTTSNVYENDLVNQSVRDFFNRKYRGAEVFLNGGKFMHVETSLRALYLALRRHETVVVVADAPALSQTRNSSGIWVPWFGHMRKVADGGLRMAQETDSLICAMVCVTDSQGGVRWLCSDVLDPRSTPKFETQLFQFMERCILQHPGKWWASHLLQDFPIQDSASEVSYD